MGTEYSALPVRLSPASPGVRYLFVRPHQPSKGATAPADSAGRTLFVAALPSSFGEAELRAVLQPFGAVESYREVRLASLPAPGALVVFDSPKALRRVLAAAREGAQPQPAPTPDGAVKRGLAAWLAEYRAARPGLAALQSSVDAWMAEHEAAAAAAAAAAEAKAAGDDGWTMVGAKRGRRKTTDGEGTAVGGVAVARAEAQAAKRPALSGPPAFYVHQRRESARAAVAELRAKFEEDKKRVAELRAARKFRPDAL